MLKMRSGKLGLRQRVLNALMRHLRDHITARHYQGFRGSGNRWRPSLQRQFPLRRGRAEVIERGLPRMRALLQLFRCARPAASALAPRRVGAQDSGPAAMVWDIRHPRERRRGAASCREGQRLRHRVPQRVYYGLPLSLGPVRLETGEVRRHPRGIDGTILESVRNAIPERG